MNTGAVSKRYAKALLLLTQQTGRGAAVCAQAIALLENPDSQMGRLEPELEKLVSLLAANGRTDHLKYVLSSFIGQYRRSVGIISARLVTAVPSPGLGDKLSAIVKEKTGFKVELTEVVNPDIIGGFVFDTDEYRLDASVRSRIEAVRRQFIEKNTRLV